MTTAKTHSSAYLSSHHVRERLGAALQRMAGTRVLVVGDTIIDEYVFCQTMAKSGKSPILAARHLYTEQYAGGILAIANHLAGFCAEVRLLSQLGAEETHDAFIARSLAPNVRPDFVRKPNAPTIVKRRFLEEYRAIKLFEVYEMRNEDASGPEEETLLDRLDTWLAEYDTVIVADYGHGMLTDRVIERLCGDARFLAVNAQTNAGNVGFNFITKYTRADLISIDEPEARLEARQRNTPMPEILGAIADRIDCPRIIVTRGKHGCMCLDGERRIHEIPAFALDVVDNVGAGDAFLSLAALTAATHPDEGVELAGLMGSFAGALACGIMGNKEPVTPDGFRTLLDKMA